VTTDHLLIANNTLFIPKAENDQIVPLLEQKGYQQR
jgi:hypothetical protein